MGLQLLSRTDATFPTSWNVSLFGAVVGATSSAPAGVADVTSGGGGLGVAPLGTSALGA